MSGLLLDPEIFISHSRLSSYPEVPNGSPLATVHRQASLQTRSSELSFSQRLQGFHSQLTRPFTLPHRSQVDRSETQLIPVPTRSSTLGERITEKALATGQHLQSYIRDPSQASQLSKVLGKDIAESISLPFRLSLTQAHDKTRRNLPYLRQGWCRIDFIAIISFWVTFVLATTGVEKGSHHIGIFRALSVLRTARLLTITSGTTVSSRHPASYQGLTH